MHRRDLHSFCLLQYPFRSTGVCPVLKRPLLPELTDNNKPEWALSTVLPFIYYHHTCVTRFCLSNDMPFPTPLTTEQIIVSAYGSWTKRVWKSYLHINAGISPDDINISIVSLRFYLHFSHFLVYHGNPKVGVLSLFFLIIITIIIIISLHLYAPLWFVNGYFVSSFLSRRFGHSWFWLLREPALPFLLYFSRPCRSSFIGFPARYRNINPSARLWPK